MEAILIKLLSHNLVDIATWHIFCNNFTSFSKPYSGTKFHNHNAHTYTQISFSHFYAAQKMSAHVKFLHVEQTTEICKISRLTDSACEHTLAPKWRSRWTQNAVFAPNYSPKDCTNSLQLQSCKYHSWIWCCLPLPPKSSRQGCSNPTQGGRDGKILPPYYFSCLPLASLSLIQDLIP